MNENAWKIDYHIPEVPDALLRSGFSPLLSAILTIRGITDPKEASKIISGHTPVLHDPFSILGMENAVARVRKAIENHEKVAVYGDYDVDGITATCLLSDYLTQKGLEVEPYIPDRNDEGYGLNCGALDHFRAAGITLVITVDCGITAVKETLHAAEIGVDMLITDHHECKDGCLPAAAALIDCRQPGDTYPNPHLAGVGMAFKLVCACEGDSRQMLEAYADLVAIGTIADVMPLVGENRYLVRTGIDHLRQRPRLGLAAMLQESASNPKTVSASFIGYTLAPRLNAAGRLGQALMAKDLIMSRDRAEATRLASELCSLNRRRQHIENEIWKDAAAQLQGEDITAPIVLASTGWNQGVIGIAASRLAEQYAVPTIMICLNQEKGKGSCRSYGEFNLFEALSACSEHLISYGGHAMAAGLNIRQDQIGPFRQAIAAYYRANPPQHGPETVCDLLITDPGILSVGNVRSLDLLEPYGNGNPKPVLCLLGVELLRFTVVAGGKHLKLRLRCAGHTLEGIFFSHATAGENLRDGMLLDVAFQPQLNEFHGKESVQLAVCALRPHDGTGISVAVLAGERSCLSALAPFCPRREDFVRVWKRLGRSFTLAGTPERILSLCPEGMPPETFALCLCIFQQAGLISPGKSLCGRHETSHVGKVDLEETAILRTLHAILYPPRRRP